MDIQQVQQLKQNIDNANNRLIAAKTQVEMAKKRQQEILQEFNCNSYEELQQLLNAKEIEMQKLIDSANAYYNSILPIINEVESLTQVL